MFEGLKAALMEEPVLTLPDNVKTFEIHMNASEIAINLVLIQDRHPIAIESRKLNEAK